MEYTKLWEKYAMTRFHLERRAGEPSRAEPSRWPISSARAGSRFIGSAQNRLQSVYVFSKIWIKLY